MYVPQLDSLGHLLIQLVARMQFPREQFDVARFSAIAGPAIRMANVELDMLHGPGALLWRGDVEFDVLALWIIQIRGLADDVISGGIGVAQGEQPGECAR